MDCLPHRRGLGGKRNQWGRCAKLRAPQCGLLHAEGAQLPAVRHSGGGDHLASEGSYLDRNGVNCGSNFETSLFEHHHRCIVDAGS